MTAYRKKPVVIEAVEWTGANLSECLAFLGYSPSVMPNDHGCIIIGTLEGTMKASFGDWIIRGVKGEFYPCKPDIFEATYELATLPPDPAPTTREPCGAWEDDGIPSEDGGGWELEIGPVMAIARPDGRDAWAWEVIDTDGSIYNAESQGKAASANEAKLAAEDAADALLLAGRRALGRIT